MKNKEVIIIIPIYKNKLSKLEEISLQQLNKILHKYSKCFLGPKSLDFNYGEEYENFKVERFEDCYFQSVESYSRLMLSEEFYKRFVEYEYMLIYQLDAFVFSDQLEAFCKMNYDYIGAPWPSWVENWRLTKSYVGNGGFSLRRISKVINLLQNTGKIAWYFEKYEDAFLAHCGHLKIADFTVAPVDVAIEFSMEFDVRKAYKKLPKRLPFGCHGWYVTNFFKWKPIIETYGYEIAIDELEVDFWDKQRQREECLYNYLRKRIFRYGNQVTIRNVLQQVLDKTKKYGIWGTGIVGERCINSLLEANFKVSRVYDQSSDKLNTKFHDISVLNPDKLKIFREKDDLILIIAVRRYEYEITKELINFGLEEGRHFITYSCLAKMFIKMYYHK